MSIEEFGIDNRLLDLGMTKTEINEDTIEYTSANLIITFRRGQPSAEVWFNGKLVQPAFLDLLRLLYL